jgi:hypothetical protein
MSDTIAIMTLIDSFLMIIVLGCAATAIASGVVFQIGVIETKFLSAN